MTNWDKMALTIDRDRLRMAMATSPHMETLMKDVDLMKLAAIPRLRVEDFTDEQCVEVVEWLEGKAAAPSVVTDYLDPLR